MLGLATKEVSRTEKPKPKQQPKKVTLTPDCHLPSMDALRKLKDIRKSISSDPITASSQRTSRPAQEAKPAPPKKREEEK